jgi:hypothetical protein
MLPFRPDLIEKLLQPLIASATSRLSGSSAPDAPERIVLRNSLWILNRVVKVNMLPSITESSDV